MKRRGTRFVSQYWGYLVVAALAYIWWRADNLANVAPVIVVGSLAALAYFLFLVPHTCDAITREGHRCRRNAKGLMFGCNQNREHKRQNFLRRLTVGEKWRDMNRGLWTEPSVALATLGTLAVIVSGVGGLIVNIAS